MSATWWADFHFLRPGWLWLLLPLAGLCWALHRKAGSRELLGRFCDPALLPWLTVSLGARQGGLRLLSVLLAGTLAILALAGPVAERLPQPVFREQSALVVMLDLSRSMNAQDLAPSRLARARFKLRDLLATRQRGQTALIVYSDRAFVVTPLTDDINTIVAQMEVMEPALMPNQGSDPVHAVRLALVLLEQAGYPGGDLLLVTDAVTERQRTQVAQALAAHDRTRLSVLGVGTPAGAPIPDDDGGFIKDAGGQMVIARFDPGGLDALARAGRGIFAPIAPDGRDIETIGRFLASQANGEVETANARQTEQWHELGPWLLLPVVVLAALAFRRGVLLGALLLPWLAAAPPARAADWWLTPDQAGQRAFEREDYAGAARRYEDPAWRAAARYRAGEYDAAAQELAQRDDAESLYNRGNALARLGRFDEALEAYGSALERASDHTDARYNKSLIEDLLRQQEEAQQPPEEQRKDESARDPQDGDEGQGQGEGEARQGQAGERESDMTPPSEAGDEASKEQESDAEAGQSQSSQQDAANARAGNAATDEPAAEDRDAEQAEARNDAASQHEEALAAEQWLRQVPDDPGGLWRRKFRYQYQQKYGGQSGSAEPW